MLVDIQQGGGGGLVDIQQGGGRRYTARRGGGMLVDIQQGGVGGE